MYIVRNNSSRFQAILKIEQQNLLHLSKIVIEHTILRPKDRIFVIYPVIQESSTFRDIYLIRQKMNINLPLPRNIRIYQT